MAGSSPGHGAPSSAAAVPVGPPRDIGEGARRGCGAAFSLVTEHWWQGGGPFLYTEEGAESPGGSLQRVEQVLATHDTLLGGEGEVGGYPGGSATMLPHGHQGHAQREHAQQQPSGGEPQGR